MKRIDLFEPVSNSVVFGFGCIVLGIILSLTYWIKESAHHLQPSVIIQQEVLTKLLFEKESVHDLLALKSVDLENFKASLENEANLKKSLFETNVMVHDEKRLLEKQWDIMTTSLLIDAETKRISLLKNDVPVDHFLLSSVPEIYGSSPSIKVLPQYRITSKERFAHPERGKAENVNGVLQWTPAQVGTSLRANALGEYVIFTDGALILHGPPTKPEDHSTYPHQCFHLTIDQARTLYRKTYIGTKINIIQTEQTTTSTISLPSPSPLPN